ncbi:YbaB/EbfC family DNA-binding protein [Amycolatopsis suaedae]|uniref:YbaB/EbfC family DNA-binding protein n=1 Tax=Amycolatopsis suaedae TaxID=2510978 RepID=A0A4V2ELP1_9PSEU|nr:YbaB/EbfC family DNA-binding protein [Amycolatopsis suaedae]RZQ62245.1 YbaB/EbfC family DNA-binding protein [Amycolatopsis suaedae]
MVDEIPIHNTTQQLIEQTRARREAVAQVEQLMSQARGKAHDVDNTIEVTVDALGKLVDLWLAPTAASWGAPRLGELIVEVAEIAHTEAVQDSYNKVALALGDDMTLMIEQISGQRAPARRDDDDPGITVEEFQRRREERLARQAPQPARREPVQEEDDDLYSFDPASLRSDR